jgi:hypothetical protein
MVAEHLDVLRVEVVMIPSDCTDGFGCAYWNRPEAHLNPVVLAGMSWSSQLAPKVLAEAVEHLRVDLESRLTSSPCSVVGCLPGVRRQLSPSRS